MTLTDSRNQPVPFAQEPAKMHPITPTTQVHQPQCSEESVKHSGQWFTELSAFKPRKRYTESAFRHSAGECRQRKASWVLGPLNKLVWSRLATFKCAPHSTHTHTHDCPLLYPGGNVQTVATGYAFLQDPGRFQPWAGPALVRGGVWATTARLPPRASDCRMGRAGAWPGPVPEAQEAVPGFIVTP